MSRPKGSKNKIVDDPVAMDSLVAALTADGTEIHTDSPISRWIVDGTACKYVRFKDIPVSPAQGKEPVWEFKLDPKTKYSVDSMVYHHDGGVIFTAYGEKCIVAPGNVGYWRPFSKD